MKKKSCPRCLGTGVVQDQEELGLKAWSRRTKLGLTLCDVSRAMGIDSSYLSYLEAGKRLWSPDLIEKFNLAIGEAENKAFRLTGGKP